MADPQKIIESISELPTLPDVVAKVNELVSSSSASAGDINDVISRDIALSTKILKMVNSSFYGFPRRITSITHAVVILGFNTVRNLALSAFVFSAFKGKAGSRAFDQRAFWAHSIGTAISATALAQQMGLSQSEREDAFMAGLLHDVGKVVMCEYLPDEMNEIMKTVREEGLLFLEAERKRIDFTHADLGGALLEAWNLPPAIVSFVKLHHAPLENEEHPRPTALIHSADIIARSLCFGNGGDDSIPRLTPEVWQRLEVSWENVGSVMDQSIAEMRRAGAFFEML